MEHIANPASLTARDWYERGYKLLRARRLPGALDAFRNSIRLNTQIAAPWMGLAQVLQSNGQHEDALACLRHAVAAEPGFADAHQKLAQTLQQLGKVDEARTEFEKTIQLNPTHAAAHFGLGHLLEDTGDPEGAVAAYRQALILKPDHSEALANLLGLSRHVDVTSEIEQAQAQIETAEDRQKALIGYGLGKALEQMKDHSAAFRAFETANEARKRISGAFDRELFDKRVDAIIELLSADFFDARRGWGDPSEQPVFIVGLPRSGTTLTEQIIGSHPDCFGAGELYTLTDLATGTPDRLGSAEKPWPDCAPNLTAEHVRALGADYLAQSRALAPEGVSRVVDKQPLNFWHLSMIAMALPNARIIHCARDIRDCGLSIYTQNFNTSQQWSTDLGDIAHYWRGYKRLMAHWEAVTSLRMMTVAYEDTISDIDGQARKLLEFLGLPWDNRVLSFHENERAVQTPSRWQVRQPLYKTSMARWARYEDRLGPLIDAAAEQA